MPYSAGYRPGPCKNAKGFNESIPHQNPFGRIQQIDLYCASAEMVYKVSLPRRVSNAVSAAVIP